MARPEQGAGWLTARMPQDELDIWTRLANEKGYSRSELILLVLREVGLAFARQLEATPSGAGYTPSAEKEAA